MRFPFFFVVLRSIYNQKKGSSVFFSYGTEIGVILEEFGTVWEIFLKSLGVIMATLLRHYGDILVENSDKY